MAYGDVYDFQVTAKWANEGKLEDVTAIIEPIRGKFEPQALSTTFLYNDVAKTRAYYAYPIKQQTMHIQYWKDMLAEAGLQGKRHTEGLEGLLGVLVREGAACLPPKDRAAWFLHRLPDGRGLERLVLFVPDLHGRL